MGKSEDAGVLDQVVGLIERTRSLVGPYEYAGSGAPIGTAQICELAEKLGCELHYFAFQSEAFDMALPPVQGANLIFVDSRTQRSDQALTVRHELAHVLTGEVAEPTYLTAADTLSHSERVADLFAVADLVPTWYVRQLRGRRRPWKHTELEIKQAFRELTEGWSEQRLNDRARLRLLLFREHGF